MSDNEQDFNNENDTSDAKKMTTWGVKLDLETKNLVSETMEQSGLSGVNFIKSMCESFKSSKVLESGETLPEDLKFLDVLMSRVRSFMIAQHSKVNEIKLQLQEEANSLKIKQENAENSYNNIVKEYATVKLALEKTDTELKETKITLEKVEKHEDILFKKTKEMEQQLVDLDLWKKQAATAADKDARNVFLEKNIEKLQATLEQKNTENLEQQKHIKNLQNKLGQYENSIEALKAQHSIEIQSFQEKYLTEKTALFAQFELEKKHFQEKIELEKRSAVLAYIENNPQTKEPITKDEDFKEDHLFNLIEEIENEVNSGNYLPIFEVRERLPKGITRKRCDELLRSLRDKEIIRLSALQEGRHYTAEQFAQGIPQKSGGPLFFIIIRNREK